MTKTFPFSRLLPVSAVLVAAATNASACLTPGAVGFNWTNCYALSVYLDPSLGDLAPGPSTTPAAQMQSAINLWASTLPAMYPSVNISISVVGSSALANVILNAAPLAPSTGASQPRQNGEITEQTITFNTVFSSADPTQSGYQILFFKMALHEFGHVFGLADLNPSPCNSYSAASIMDQVCGTNDEQQGIATAPTTCDIDEVIFVYQDDPCGGGGGGGGGECGEQGAGCSSDGDCCPGLYCELGSCGGYTDPIIIDLTGRGYELTGVANGVTFDFFPNAAPIQMSWTAAGWNGGFLALDRNGNGRIDNATELFSNITPQQATKNQPANGFAALADYDLPAHGGNGDGQIDERDAIFSKLLIWVDKNHDGASQRDELLTMKQAGIQSISLKYAMSRWVDAYGNIFRYAAPISINGLSNQTVYDVVLQSAGHSSTTTAATKQ